MDFHRQSSFASVLPVSSGQKKPRSLFRVRGLVMFWSLFSCLHNNPAIPYYENEHNEANKEGSEPGPVCERIGNRHGRGARCAALAFGSVSGVVDHRSRFG
jgi:hypothetical protein